MAAGFLINAFLNEDQNVRVFADFCQRVRFRKSSCQRCLEICPEKAISLNPGPTINEGCTDCGLCQNACRAEVFRHKLHTDRYLLHQVKALLDNNRQYIPDEKKRLFFHCHRAEKRHDNSIGFQCLGRISANIILGSALAGFDEAVLAKGICLQCRFQPGEQLLANAIAVSQVLLEGVGLRRFTISIKEKEANTEALLGRREIFSLISDNVKNRAALFLCHREDAIREKLTDIPEIISNEQRLPQRELLCELIKENRPESKWAVKYNSEFPWGKIKIQQNKCSVCGTCEALCPTGAIEKKIRNGYQLLYFTSSLCTNCSLCRAACPENALDFNDKIALSDIIAKEATLVAAHPFSTCIICGEIIPARQDNSCPTCRKRQLRPMFVKV